MNSKNIRLIGIVFLILIVLFLLGIYILRPKSPTNALALSAEEYESLDSKTKSKKKSEFKDNFFDDSLKFDYKSLKDRKFSSEILSVHNRHPDVETSGNDSIKEHKDSLGALYSIIKEKNERVAVVIAANEVLVVGGYTVEKKYREGKGTQEEVAMAVLYGLLNSNLEHAGKKDGQFEKDYRGIIKYKSGIFKDSLLYSPDLSIKIGVDVYERYLKVKDKFSFFSEYIAFEYNNDKTILNRKSISKYKIDAYSIAAYDNRGRRRKCNYNSLYKDIFAKILKLLLHCHTKKTKHLVLTVPGSGVFAGGDRKYTESVNKAINDVLEKYGSLVQNIIVCPNGILKKRK